MEAVNTSMLLGSVTSEMIELIESQFSLKELDKVILDMRLYEIHLAILWFGSLKNAMSNYVPHWSKKDVKRFLTVHTLEQEE